MTDLHVHSTGGGPPVVFLHGLGMDSSVFDGIALPRNRILKIDLRGHGQSPAPAGPYAMGALIRDVERCLTANNVNDAVVFGLSLGGMIAQGLAVKRLDLIRGLVLCGTAAKFGQPGPWNERAKVAREDGLAALAPDVLARWNVTSPNAEARLLSTDAEAYAACCEAIAGTDFYTPTSGLRLPTLGLGGDRDKSTPPDLVRETANLIPGSSFHLIRGAGHLAPETHPDAVTDHLEAFLTQIGHA